MIQKEFFINAIELIPVHGSTNIPTVIHYAAGQKPAIGSDAISRAEDRSELIEDFKVDLGNINPSSTTLLKRFATPDAKARSAAELTADFLTALLDEAAAWLGRRDIERGTSILVAEPLAMQDDLVSPEWLPNYRNALRRVLSGKGFENIAYLPELSPFISTTGMV